MWSTATRVVRPLRAVAVRRATAALQTRAAVVCSRSLSAVASAAARSTASHAAAPRLSAGSSALSAGHFVIASAARAAGQPVTSALPLLFRRFASSAHQPPQQTGSANSSGSTQPPAAPQTPQSSQQKQQTTEQRQKQQQSSSESEGDPTLRAKNRNIAYYVVAVGFVCLGASYAVVPLYRKFCQVTGMGGIPQETSLDRLADLRKQRASAGIEGREVIIQFTGNVNGSLDWQFEPVQDSIRVRVGEPALAFYTARNNLDHPVVGVATYNVNPPRAGLYFNKVQCFCFDEQRVHAGEDVQLPVHFFLDTAMEDDPKMDQVNHITLSYTFFEVEHEYPDPQSPHFNPNQNHGNAPHPDAAAIAAAAVAAAKHQIATGTGPAPATATAALPPTAAQATKA